jgi:hypothetical protein
MGRNAAIKRYEATPEGQPMELFGSKHSRLPVVIELLRSPWIVRASELVGRDGNATKHAEEPVSVVWDADRQCPVSFTRGEKVWRIDGIIQVWAMERSWWDTRQRLSRRFYRVLARGGVYDLAYDRSTRTWLLTGVQD